MRLVQVILAPVAALGLTSIAAAHEVQYGAMLTGFAEIPSNAPPATGDALVTVDLDLLTMRVQVSFAGLLGNTTASHIHCCTTVPGAANVGVATTLPTFTDFPLGVTSGTYDHTFDTALATSYNSAIVTANGSIGNAFSAFLAGMDTGNA